MPPPLTNVVPEQGHVQVLLRALRVRLVVQRDEVVREATERVDNQYYLI